MPDLLLCTNLPSQAQVDEETFKDIINDDIEIANICLKKNKLAQAADDYEIIYYALEKYKDLNWLWIKKTIYKIAYIQKCIYKNLGDQGKYIFYKTVEKSYKDSNLTDHATPEALKVIFSALDQSQAQARALTVVNYTDNKIGTYYNGTVAPSTLAAPATSSQVQMQDSNKGNMSPRERYHANRKLIDHSSDNISLLFDVGDKSKFLEDLVTSDKICFFIYRPNGFGKTGIINLIRSFYDFEFQNRPNNIFNINWFDNKYIMRTRAFTQIAKKDSPYVVMCFDFSSIVTTSETSFVNTYKNIVISECKRLLRVLNIKLRQNMDRKNLYDSLDDLINIVSQNHKVIVIIKAYDAPLQRISLSTSLDKAEAFIALKELYLFISDLFNTILGNREHILKIIASGTISFISNGILAGLNIDSSSIGYETVLSGSYNIGFSEEDILTYFRNSAPNPRKDEYQTFLDSEDWYGGYYIHDRQVFNFNSIVSWQKSKQPPRVHWQLPLRLAYRSPILEHYRANRSSTITEKLLALIDNQIVPVVINNYVCFDISEESPRTDDTDSMLWLYLLSTGYITQIPHVNSSQLESTLCVIIPNRETQISFCTDIVPFALSERVDKKNAISRYKPRKQIISEWFNLIENAALRDGILDSKLKKIESRYLLIIIKLLATYTSNCSIPFIVIENLFDYYKINLSIYEFINAWQFIWINDTQYLEKTLTLNKSASQQIALLLSDIKFTLNNYNVYIEELSKIFLYNGFKDVFNNNVDAYVLAYEFILAIYQNSFVFLSLFADGKNYDLMLALLDYCINHIDDLQKSEKLREMLPGTIQSDIKILELNADWQSKFASYSDASTTYITTIEKYKEKNCSNNDEYERVNFKIILHDWRHQHYRSAIKAAENYINEYKIKKLSVYNFIIYGISILNTQDSLADFNEKLNKFIDRFGDVATSSNFNASSLTQLILARMICELKFYAIEFMFYAKILFRESKKDISDTITEYYVWLQDTGRVALQVNLKIVAPLYIKNSLKKTLGHLAIPTPTPSSSSAAQPTQQRRSKVSFFNSLGKLAADFNDKHNLCKYDINAITENLKFLSIQMGSAEMLYKAYHYAGIDSHRHGDYQQAVFFHSKALSLCRYGNAYKTNIKFERAKVHISQGNLLVANRDIDSISLKGLRVTSALILSPIISTYILRCDFFNANKLLNEMKDFVHPISDMDNLVINIMQNHINFYVGILSAAYHSNEEYAAAFYEILSNQCTLMDVCSLLYHQAQINVFQSNFSDAYSLIKSVEAILPKTFTNSPNYVNLILLKAICHTRCYKYSSAVNSIKFANYIFDKKYTHDDYDSQLKQVRIFIKYTILYCAYYNSLNNDPKKSNKILKKYLDTLESKEYEVDKLNILFILKIKLLKANVYSFLNETNIAVSLFREVHSHCKVPAPIKAEATLGIARTRGSISRSWLDGFVPDQYNEVDKIRSYLDSRRLYGYQGIDDLSKKLQCMQKRSTHSWSNGIVNKIRSILTRNKGILDAINMNVTRAQMELYVSLYADVICFYCILMEHDNAIKYIDGYNNLVNKYNEKFVGNKTAKIFILIDLKLLVFYDHYNIYKVVEILKDSEKYLQSAPAYFRAQHFITSHNLCCVRNLYAAFGRFCGSLEWVGERDACLTELRQLSNNSYVALAELLLIQYYWGEFEAQIESLSLVGTIPNDGFCGVLKYSLLEKFILPLCLQELLTCMEVIVLDPMVLIYYFKFKIKLIKPTSISDEMSVIKADFIRETRNAVNEESWFIYYAAVIIDGKDTTFYDEVMVKMKNIAIKLNLSAQNHYFPVTIVSPEMHKLIPFFDTLKSPVFNMQRNLNNTSPLLLPFFNEGNEITDNLYVEKKCIFSIYALFKDQLVDALTEKFKSVYFSKIKWCFSFKSNSFSISPSIPLYTNHDSILLELGKFIFSFFCLNTRILSIQLETNRITISDRVVDDGEMQVTSIIKFVITHVFDLSSQVIHSVFNETELVNITMEPMIYINMIYDYVISIKKSEQFKNLENLKNRSDNISSLNPTEQHELIAILAIVSDQIPEDLFNLWQANNPFCAKNLSVGGVAPSQMSGSSSNSGMEACGSIKM